MTIVLPVGCNTSAGKDVCRISPFTPPLARNLEGDASRIMGSLLPLHSTAATDRSLDIPMGGLAVVVDVDDVEPRVRNLEDAASWIKSSPVLSTARSHS